MSPETKARILKWVTSVIAAALIVGNVVKPEWATQMTEIAGDLGRLVEVALNIVAAVFLLGSSGKPKISNVV